MLLIDADHLFVYRIGFAVEHDPNGFTAAKYNIQTALNKYMQECGQVKKRLFLTGKDNFRHNVATILPYKGNRKTARRPTHYQAIRDHLVEVFNAEIIDGMEADDAMGIAQMENYHTPEHAGDTGYCGSVIVAADKDMDMIPGWHYNPLKDKHYFMDDLEAMRCFWSQVLTGDSTDNIPGLKGVGPKGAQKLLGSLTTEDSMEGVVSYAYSKACTERKGKGIKEGHKTGWAIDLKGQTKWYDSHGGYVDDLNEIKQLLWIRRR